MGTILECKTTEHTTWEHRDHLSYLEACLQGGKFRDWFEDRVCPVLCGGGWRAGGQRCSFTQIYHSSLSATIASRLIILGIFHFGYASAFPKCLNLHWLRARPTAKSPVCMIHPTVFIIPSVQVRKLRHEEVWWFRKDSGFRFGFPLHLSWAF